MKLLQRILNYLNPIARFGNTHRSFLLPTIVTILSAVFLEIYVVLIAHDPATVGLPAIFFFIALIIYFSFRDGILAGVITTTITLFFYLYLIFSLHYTGTQFTSGINTTIVLGILYYFLSAVIGGLKQTIDVLIEREANEKRRLQAIIQQLPVGIMLADEHGVITQGNRQAEIILGMKTPIGYNVHAPANENGKYKAKPLNRTQGPLAQVMTSGVAIKGKEYVLEKHNGKKVHLQVSSAPIHNRIGKLIAAAVIFSDITQQRETEARKDDFVNMASHELKTPITSMKLYIDVLLGLIEQYKNEKANRILKNIKLQTENLQQLVNDLLDVSRLQTGKLNFRMEKFQLDIFLEDVVNQLRGITTQQNLVVTKTMPLTVSADKFRIYQVLTNLITNAVKYSDDNKDIYIALNRSAHTAVISVQDYGIGIDKSQQRKIFDRLYQVAEPQEQTFPGFGMGLYISKEIIKRHNGKIWVKSQKGKGSTFYFSLPLEK